MSKKKPIGLKGNSSEKAPSSESKADVAVGETSQSADEILNRLANGDADLKNAELAKRLNAKSQQLDVDEASVTPEQIKDQTQNVLWRMKKDDPSRYLIDESQWEGLVKALRNGNPEPLVKRFLKTKKLGPTYVFATNTGARAIAAIWERKASRYINLPENVRLKSLKQILSILAQSPEGYNTVAPQIINGMRQHLPSYEVKVYEDAMLDYVELVVKKQTEKVVGPA